MQQLNGEYEILVPLYTCDSFVSKQSFQEDINERFFIDILSQAWVSRKLVSQSTLQIPFRELNYKIYGREAALDKIPWLSKSAKTL